MLSAFNSCFLLKRKKGAGCRRPVVTLKPVRKPSYRPREGSIENRNESERKVEQGSGMTVVVFEMPLFYLMNLLLTVVDRKKNLNELK